VYWWVLTTANAAGTNCLICLPIHEIALDFLVINLMTGLSGVCLTSAIAPTVFSDIKDLPQLYVMKTNYVNSMYKIKSFKTKGEEV
jgi:hypothetical protein